MNSPEAPGRPAIFKQPSAAQLQPLYPVTRLMPSESLRVEQQRAEAGEILAQARREAQDIIAQANEQAQQLRQEALTQGRDQAAAEFHRLFAELSRQGHKLSSQFAQEVTRVGFRLAREILDVEFRLSHESVVALVREAIAEVRSRFPQSLTLRLSVEDGQRVRASLARLRELLPGEVMLSVNTDGNLPAGSLVIETEMGHFDFSVGTRLAQLQRELEKVGQHDSGTGLDQPQA